MAKFHALAMVATLTAFREVAVLLLCLLGDYSRVALHGVLRWVMELCECHLVIVLEFPLVLILVSHAFLFLVVHSHEVL